MPDLPTPPADITAPASDPAAPQNPVVLSQDQATAAGLTAAQPGDTFTATLTVKSADENGVSLDIADAMPNEAPAPEGDSPTISKFPGPKELGL